ncbi:MAG: hypothetical protein PHC54_03815 [Candidatus Omnitrophica bacterium]|nr:hypothetical protein [Candidatus Omnitrophota bacterium]MDD5592323.1 hypothetical protein [Candidatus Omnitrophota bacterium]
MKGYTLYAIRYTLILFLIGNLLGCDAFVRKFTRKSKRDKPAPEMVLMPEEYKPPPMTKEEVYRKYFIFWKSWQDELINSFIVSSVNHKKQISCANEAIKNLELLRAALQEKKQKEFDVYINRMKALKESIAEDLYGNNMPQNRLSAERIRRGIMRDFSYSKVKNYLL